ncbi:hypothetical protein BZG36_00501 [Bifiguratus adelaidae]|uniref:REJ domain-containing protein n=1 Tax=Bifiguratus adelaidae TaxID=1938954 RepID=A0A261Y7C5_9FUNG|nr:hypothetical protein BZG36_00501 [Bifiguratus adelaidae]
MRYQLFCSVILASLAFASAQFLPGPFQPAVPLAQTPGAPAVTVEALTPAVTAAPSPLSSFVATSVASTKSSIASSLSAHAQASTSSGSPSSSATPGHTGAASSTFQTSTGNALLAIAVLCALMQWV